MRGSKPVEVEAEAKRNQAKERNSAEDEPDDEGDLQITKQCEDYSGRSRGYGAGFRIVWR